MREGSQPFPLPRYLQLYPTHRCNQACSFCFNDSTNPAKDLSFDNACRLIDIMLEQGIYDLDIMGGEPFLLAWMPDFIRRANDADIIVNISTNGSLPETFEKLGGIAAERLNIGVSLEGSTDENHNRLTRSGNFLSAIRSIGNLLAMDLNPIVKTVINRSTRDDIRNMLHLLGGLGVQRYYLIHMDLFSHNPTARQDAMGFMEFLMFYRETTSENHGFTIDKVNASCFEKHSLPVGARCAGGVRKLSVMSDGTVYPCNLFQHFPQFNLGNIFTGGFTDIWNSTKLDFFRNFDRNECGIMQCSNHASCTGGCPAHAYFHDLNVNGTDIRCTKP